MNCPHCQASRTQELTETTDLSYAVFRCGRCQRKFNERTGSPFNYLEFPTDIVFQVVLCRLRYKLSLRDLAEMFSLGACREADFVAPASTTFTDADFPLWSRLVPLTG